MRVEYLSNELPRRQYLRPSGTLCNTTLGICVQCGCAECSAAKLTCTGGLVCDPTGACSPPGVTLATRFVRAAAALPRASPMAAATVPLRLARPTQRAKPCLAPLLVTITVQRTEVTAMIALSEVTLASRYRNSLGHKPWTAWATISCNVPSALFDAQNAAKVIAYNATPLEIATVRIAWSSSGIHAFIDVLDASVQTVYGYLQTQPTADQTQAITDVYQGDSIELMISSSNAVTGLTGNDANTLHVIVPASGPAVSVKITEMPTTPARERKPLCPATTPCTLRKLRLLAIR